MPLADHYTQLIKVVDLLDKLKFGDLGLIFGSGYRNPKDVFNITDLVSVRKAGSSSVKRCYNMTQGTTNADPLGQNNQIDLQDHYLTLTQNR